MHLYIVRNGWRFSCGWLPHALPMAWAAMGAAGVTTVLYMLYTGAVPSLALLPVCPKLLPAAAVLRLVEPALVASTCMTWTWLGISVWSRVWAYSPKIAP